MESRQQQNMHFLTFVSFLCISSSPARGSQIRLAGYGSTDCSGRVEIYYRGTWGTVCDDSWDLNDAKVVCRQLGCGAALRETSSAFFGLGTGEIWLDEVQCSGKEKSLSECGHRVFGENDCSHSEDAGVVCSGSQIRLAGYGSTDCSGRVEIYYRGTWGTVCDDSWDLNDAKVVCRQLGCGAALRETSSAFFGLGTGEIWLDEVQCSGKEKSLSECGHRVFGENDCSHSEDAGVICSASLPKPNISITPTGEVPWGQKVSITCSSPAEAVEGTFILIFHKLSDSFRRTETSSNNSAVFTISKVNFDNEGLYQCQQEKSISSQTFSSNLSDFVTLNVTVQLPQPSISMIPVGLATWGQDVDITCSISTQYLGGTFTLQQMSSSYKMIQTSSTNYTIFRIPQVKFDKEGSYQCWYQTRLSSRDFSSPLSDSVRLSVIVRLPRPNIFLTSPNNGLVWSPEGAEITETYSFVFICSINSTYSGGHFFLFFSGSNTSDSKPAVNHSASFEFPLAQYKHQGNYSCMYEVTLSSQTFSSAETVQITVLVQFPLLLLASSVTAGILLLLLLVLLVGCVVYRRRRQDKHPEILIFSQVAENNYEIDEDNDYMNIDEVHTKKKLELEEEDNDYEDPESDDHHDYEEADCDDSMPQEVCYSEEDNYEEVGEEVDREEGEEEEEEEESSDDENDYVNVTCT